MRKTNEEPSMRLRSGILIACVLALPARAQVTPMPGLMPAEWRMEARGLDDKKLGLVLPCMINTLSANLRLSAPQMRTKIVPTVGFDFSVPRPAIELALLHIEDDGDGKPVLLLKKYGGPKVVPDVRFPGPVAYGKDVAVTVRWNGAGRIEVTAAGKTAVMTLSRAPEGLELLVQGGKADITNIRTAWTGPGQAAACARPLR
jgi:hypothetical protein